MIKLPPAVLEQARIARVLPCAICTMHVAHEAIAAAGAFTNCTHLMFVCLRCRASVHESVLQAAADAHAASCSRRIIPATKVPEPEPEPS